MLKRKHVLFVACLVPIFFQSYAAHADGISKARQAELIHLLKQDCGSCHGLTLEGGLGPPLLPANLAGKPAEWLRRVILDGIPDTAMPPWRAFMTEQEADWLVSIMKKGLPSGK